MQKQNFILYAIIYLLYCFYFYEAITTSKKKGSVSLRFTLTSSAFFR